MNENQFPDEIYRRRRFAAIGAAILAVVVLVIIFFLVKGNGSSNDSSTSSASSADTTNLLPSQTLPPTKPVSVTPITKPGTPIPGKSTPPPPPVQNTVAPSSNQCPDTSMAVAVSADKTNYPLGSHPIFTARATNTGLTSCVRNVGTGMEEFDVYNLNNLLIWSNKFCDLEVGVNYQTLQPGAQVGYKMQWQGSSATAGCPANTRVPIPVGSYYVVARLGNVTSPPFTFNVYK